VASSCAAKICRDARRLRKLRYPFPFSSFVSRAANIITSRTRRIGMPFQRALDRYQQAEYEYGSMSDSRAFAQYLDHATKWQVAYSSIGCMLVIERCQRTCHDSHIQDTTNNRSSFSSTILTTVFSTLPSEILQIVARHVAVLHYHETSTRTQYRVILPR